MTFEDVCSVIRASFLVSGPLIKGISYIHKLHTENRDLKEENEKLRRRRKRRSKVVKAAS